MKTVANRSLLHIEVGTLGVQKVVINETRPEDLRHALSVLPELVSDIDRVVTERKD